MSPPTRSNPGYVHDIGGFRSQIFHENCKENPYLLSSQKKGIIKSRSCPWKKRGGGKILNFHSFYSRHKYFILWFTYCKYFILKPLRLQNMVLDLERNPNKFFFMKWKDKKKQSKRTKHWSLDNMHWWLRNLNKKFQHKK